jgi:hypothetical protein
VLLALGMKLLLQLIDRVVGRAEAVLAADSESPSLPLPSVRSK